MNQKHTCGQFAKLDWGYKKDVQDPEEPGQKNNPAYS